MTRISNTHTVSIVENSALAVEASNTSVGQMRQITSGSIVTGLTAAFLSSGANTILEWAYRGHYDYIHRRLHFWGAGHQTEDKHIVYEENFNGGVGRWVIQHSWVRPGGIGHGYYHLALNRQTGDLYMHEYSQTANRKWAWATQTWGEPGTTVANLNGGYYTGTSTATGIDWHPGFNGGAGGLHCFNFAESEMWNPGTNSWSFLTQSLTNLNYHGWSCNTSGGVYFGLNSLMHRANSNGTISANLPAPPVGLNFESAGIVTHPDNNQLVLFDTPTGSIYKFDGSAWGGALVSKPTSDSRFVGFTLFEYGVILFLSQSGPFSAATVWMYRPPV